MLENSKCTAPQCTHVAIASRNQPIADSSGTVKGGLQKLTLPIYMPLTVSLRCLLCESGAIEFHRDSCLLAWFSLFKFQYQSKKRHYLFQNCHVF